MDDALNNNRMAVDYRPNINRWLQTQNEKSNENERDSKNENESEMISSEENKDENQVGNEIITGQSHLYATVTNGFKLSFHSVNTPLC